MNSKIDQKAHQERDSAGINPFPTGISSNAVELPFESRMSSPFRAKRMSANLPSISIMQLMISPTLATVP